MRTIETIAEHFANENWGDGNDASLERQKLACRQSIELAQRWISVDDELPNDDDKYLVKITGFGIGLHPFNVHYQCWDDEDGDDYFTDAKGGKITHWRKIELL